MAAASNSSVAPDCVESAAPKRRSLTPPRLAMVAVAAAGMLLSPGSPASPQMVLAEEPGLYTNGMFYRPSYIRSLVAASTQNASPVQTAFLDDAMRPGARAYFVLDDFDSYVSPSQLDPKEIVPLDTAKAKKLSDGNPMSGAYLNADSTDPQNLVYMDTLMDLPATVDSSGKVVAFKLRSQMTRKLNSYDWDVVNGTSRFDDAPLVENAEWEDDKEFLTVKLTLKRPLDRSNDMLGIQYKGSNTGLFFAFPETNDPASKDPATTSALQTKGKGVESGAFALQTMAFRLGALTCLAAALLL